MNEIENMYKNAGFIKKQCKDYSCIVCDKNNNCEKYPPFTAEKQLELIKWLAKKDYGDYTSSISITITDDRCYFSAGEKPKYFANEVLYDSNRFTDFEQSLSNLINCLWQDLTEEEKQQIKEILE